MMNTPHADEIEKLDLDFWGIRLREPYVCVGHLPWPMDRCHTMLGTITTLVGPDVLASLVSALPVLFSRGAVVQGVTAILVERSDRLEVSLRNLLGSNLLREALSDLYVVQGNPGAQLVESAAEVLAPRNRSGRRMFASVMDVYAAAWASGLENLLPLGPGGIESRRSTPPPYSHAPVPEAEGERLTEAVSQAETRAVHMVTIRHITAWLKTR